MKGMNRFDRQSLFTAKKYAQIIGLFSKKEHLSLDDALIFEYKENDNSRSRGCREIDSSRQEASG